MSGCNYASVLYIPGIQACQISACASVAQDSQCAWICLNNALWQGYGYALSTFHRLLNKPTALNMQGVRMWLVYEYARVTQGAEYAWISVNMP